MNNKLPTILPNTKAVSICKKYSTLYSFLIFSSLAMLGMFLPLTKLIKLVTVIGATSASSSKSILP